MEDEFKYFDLLTPKLRKLIREADHGTSYGGDHKIYGIMMLQGEEASENYIKEKYYVDR